MNPHVPASKPDHSAPRDSRQGYSTAHIIAVSKTGINLRATPRVFPDGVTSSPRKAPSYVDSTVYFYHRRLLLGRRRHPEREECATNDEYKKAPEVSGVRAISIRAGDGED